MLIQETVGMSIIYLTGIMELKNLYSVTVNKIEKFKNGTRAIFDIFDHIYD